MLPDTSALRGASEVPAAMTMAPIFAVKTELEAALLVTAAVKGVVPRLTRPLQSEELLSLIRHGAVFVFGQQESGICEWRGANPHCPDRTSDHLP